MVDRLIRGVLSSRLLIIVLAALVMAAGWVSYRQLPVDAFPDVSPNLVQVFTVTEGLAPEEIEKYVTFPVEVVMNGLPGVEEIRSVSNFGLSVVNVYFQDRVDIYFARQVVGERLQEAREQIPEGFGDPRMGPISTGMGLILFYYLEDTTGRYTLEELRTIQDWLVKLQLQTVPGVTEVLGIGGWEKQFHVEVNPIALLRYDVSLAAVIEAVRANNLNVGAQFLERNAEELIVRSVGLVTGIKDLERVVIKTVDGTPVFLADIAEIRVGGAIRRGLQTRNGDQEVVAGSGDQALRKQLVDGHRRPSKRSSRRSTASFPKACVSCPTTSRRAWSRPRSGPSRPLCLPASPWLPPCCWSSWAGFGRVRWSCSRFRSRCSLRSSECACSVCLQT